MSEKACFWVGRPDFNEYGGAVAECGTLEVAGLIGHLEHRYGRFVMMHVDIVPGVVGFVTITGYRIAVCEPSLVDNDTDCLQEQVSEWVEGCW